MNSIFKEKTLIHKVFYFSNFSEQMRVAPICPFRASKIAGSSTISIAPPEKIIDF